MNHQHQITSVTTTWSALWRTVLPETQAQSGHYYSRQVTDTNFRKISLKHGKHSNKHLVRWVWNLLMVQKSLKIWTWQCWPFLESTITKIHPSIKTSVK